MHNLIKILIPIIIIVLIIIILVIVFKSKKTQSQSQITGPFNSATQKYSETHLAQALVMGCMDYRFVDYSIRKMEEEFGYEFDYIATAGSELFVINGAGTRLHYRNTFYDNLQLAIALHHIHTVAIISHEDCGAYKSIYGDFPSPREEKDKHIENLNILKIEIASIYPTLSFQGYYQYANYKIERVI